MRRVVLSISALAALVAQLALITVSAGVWVEARNVVDGVCGSDGTCSDDGVSDVIAAGWLLTLAVEVAVALLLVLVKRRRGGLGGGSVQRVGPIALDTVLATVLVGCLSLLVVAAQEVVLHQLAEAGAVRWAVWGGWSGLPPRSDSGTSAAELDQNRCRRGGWVLARRLSWPGR